MIVDSTETAHQYAQAWLRESTPARAARFLVLAIEGQRKCIGLLRSNGKAPLTLAGHVAAVSVLETYLEKIRNGS